MKRRYAISSVALAGLAGLGLSGPALSSGGRDENVKDAPASLFEMFKAEKGSAAKQHRSHSSHGSHRSHRSGGGGVRPTPRYTPPPPPPAPRRQESDASPASSILPEAPATAYRGTGADRELTLLARVQLMLLARGFYNGTVDGMEGPMTRSAIANFREKNGLPVAGGLDWQFLRELGLQSVVVRRVQEALLASGYYQGPLTGAIDGSTEAAIRRYRAVQGLAVTGDIDDTFLISLGITA